MKHLWVFFVWLPLYAAGTVPNRYLVELETEPVATHIRRVPRGRMAALRSVEARQHRSRVRAEQRQARGRVEAQGARVLESMDTVANALVVEAPDAARLERLPGVRRVLPVYRIRKMMLDRAVPLLKAHEAWSAVGVENAGAGVKVAIIDSGIDITHPGFKDPSLPIPEGFPLATSEDDLAYTNNKVIVARSYAALFDKPDPDPSARDDDGHGTAAAMAAAGVPNSGPRASIAGMAPRAWLGSYKIFGTPGVNDSPPFDVLLKAIDDAVADGMDVINLSLGSDVAPRLEIDPMVQALERAAALGVIVAVSAGNNGPDANTLASPATAPSVIAVGASNNDRLFASAASVDGAAFVAVPATNSVSAPAVTGLLMDVSRLDNDGLACAPLPGGSLTGAIAFILRGVCLFSEKIANAQQAGAVAALVYTDRERPEPSIMDVGTTGIPAEMVSHADGLEIKRRIASPIEGTLRFLTGPVPVDPDRLAPFSSRGPGANGAVKPDLVAVGTNLYTAAETVSPGGGIYARDGYADVDGTSFSAPLVAGAAALLKSARPGLTAAQYRSLLVNSATPLSLAPGIRAGVQQSGTGVLDAGAALRSTLAAAPVSLSFGTGGPDPNVLRHLTLTNIGTAEETYLISVLPRDGAPGLDVPSQVRLDPGASAQLPVVFAGAGLQPGAYEGYLVAQGTVSGVESRIPYWYAVSPGAPRRITVLATDDAPEPGSNSADAIMFRVTDAAGVALTDIEPVVTVVSGGGTVTRVRSRDGLYPGVWGVNVQYGFRRGANVFKIEVGGLSREVTVVTR